MIWELYDGNQLIKVFAQPLSEIEQPVLDLLDIDAAVYR